MSDGNISDEISNATASGRESATTEGLISAYCALLVMAVVPIYVGSLRSVWYHADMKVSSGDSDRDNSRTPLSYPASILSYKCAVP